MSIKLIALFAFCLVLPSSADLEAFVYDKMLEFRSYIEQHNLDPTPPDERSANFSGWDSVVSLDSETSDLVISGYSTDIYVVGVSPDLELREFSLSFESDEPFTATGTHVTNWTVQGTPLTSQGYWIGYYSLMFFSSCGIKFSVLPSGYLNVTEVTGPCELKWRPHNVTFEGISGSEAAAGYEDYLDPLLQRVADYGISLASDTIKDMFGQFWTEVLSKTTLEEIIGHTGMYTSTTPYPCASYASFAEATVLESKVVTNGNGELVRRTKMIVVKEEKL